jgi:hypothetical protein
MTMLALTAVLSLVTGVVLLVASRLVRALRQTVELEQRIARLQEGVNLLTDTAETGFRQVAVEIERLARPAGPLATPVPRPTAARLRAAARRGRSVKEIAAAEHVSEGEVRLRLSLAEASAVGRTRRTASKADVALRA